MSRGEHIEDTCSYGRRRQLAEAFLIAHGAQGIPHPGGSLYQHLLRTEARLQTWGARDVLVLAGLCHATYGTDGFHHALLPPSRRRVLADIVGKSAETIVYVYASCAREATYRELVAGRALLHDRFDGAVRSLDDRPLADFVELTFANELDVIQHNKELKRRLGRDLARLSKALAGHASLAARSALHAELSDLVER